MRGVRALVMMLGMVVTLALAACNLSGPAATEHCERIGDRCQLDPGLQGVCAPTQQSDCAQPPCLACMPQH